MTTSSDPKMVSTILKKYFGNQSKPDIDFARIIYNQIVNCTTIQIKHPSTSYGTEEDDRDHGWIAALYARYVTPV